MIALRKSRLPWKLWWIVSGALLLISGRGALATGFYGTNQFLDEGGKSVEATPEFYWELEVKRLARDFKPAEKWRAPNQARTNSRPTWTRRPRWLPEI